MKKLNKKGFTIVELVIVIAVIAILAAVLIPTFSKVIQKANESAALQNARNIYTEYIADLGEKVPESINIIVKGDDTRYFAVINGQLSTTVCDDKSSALNLFTGNTKTSGATTGSFSDDVWTVKITNS